MCGITEKLHKPCDLLIPVVSVSCGLIFISQGIQCHKLSLICHEGAFSINLSGALTQELFRGRQWPLWCVMASWYQLLNTVFYGQAANSRGIVEKVPWCPQLVGISPWRSNMNLGPTTKSILVTFQSQTLIAIANRVGSSR